MPNKHPTFEPRNDSIGGYLAPYPFGGDTIGVLLGLFFNVLIVLPVIGAALVFRVLQRRRHQNER